MRNLRIFAALFLAFGSLFFIQPAQAQTVQFTYYWTAQSFTFTDRLVSVVVTNNITNSVNRGPVADTYRISVGNNILINTSEIHAARTYTFAISGTQTIRLEGIDNGFWAGYYGPIMQITSEPLSAAPQPEPTSTASPESTLSPESQSATSSPDSSSPSSESVSAEVVPSESAPVEPTPSPSESSPIESQSPQVTQSPEVAPQTESPTASPTTSPQPESSSPQPTPIIWDYVVNEGWVLQASAPASMVFSGVVARYVAHDSDCGIDVSQIVGAVFIGTNMASIGADNGVFGDPCPGWYKKLTVAFTYANDPAAVPTQTLEPTPTPSPEPTPQPTQPQPVEPSPPVDPTPEPTPEPVDPTPTPTPEPEPSPTTTPTPTPTEQPEPEPSETAQPSPTPDPEPEEPAPTVDPKPEPSPEPKPEAPASIEEIASDTPIEDVVAVIENIVPTSLTEEQVAVLVSIAMETFETAEQGSPEYEAALDLLLVAAQADDIVLNEELAAIPLIGNVAGAAVEVFNALGNAGADMSPQVREQSEKVVIAAVIVGQVAMTAVASATSAASVAARRP